MRSAHWLVLLLMLTGCELFNPKPMPMEPVVFAPSTRLAPASLPFELAGDLPVFSDGAIQALNFGRSMELGPQVARSMFVSGTADDLSRLVTHSLVAVAALPDRVVVVFPAAPDGVMMVAQGGRDVPWSAVPLDGDLKRPQVGALDAVATHDGAVLIAVRRRPDALTLYRWKADATIVKEALPHSGPNTHWSTSRCSDVRLDESENGGVAVAFLAGKQVGFLWRRAGSTAWEFQLTPKLALTSHYDTGCMNRVVFDDSGFPQLLSLTRVFAREPMAPVPYDNRQPGVSDPSWSPAGFHQIGLVGNGTPVTSTVGYSMRADGLLSRNSLPGPTAGIEVPRYWHSGFYAMDRHPGGYVVSGPNIGVGGGSNLATISMGTSQLGRDPLSPLPDISTQLRLPTVGGTAGSTLPDTLALKPQALSEHIAFEPCGDIALWGGNSSYVPELARGFTRFSTAFCPAVPLAPVLTAADAPVVDGQPVFAHGLRSYEVAVCTTGTHMAICMGGWKTSTSKRWFSDETAPTLISSIPAEGSVVSVSTAEVVLTLSRAPAEGELVSAVVTKVDAAEGTQVVPVVDGASVRIPLPTPLIPGTTWRVGLSIGTGDTTWTYIAQRAPVVTFKSEKSPGVIDPRLYHGPRRCLGTRVNGICELAEKIGGRTTSADVIQSEYDFDARPLGLPSVYDAQGTQVTDVTVEMLGGSTKFTWLSNLARNARYEVRFPAGIVNGYGVEWHTDDLRIGLTTVP